MSQLAAPPVGVRSARAVLVIVALLAAIAAGSLVATKAIATTYTRTYCDKSWASGATCVWSDYHHLQSNTAYNYYNAYYRVCAGAKDSDGSNHGSFYCGYRVSPSVGYGGAAAYAAIHNGDPSGQSMYGKATF